MSIRKVFISGASSGIGKSLAKKFNAEGFYVFLSSRRKEELVNVQNGLKFPQHSEIVELDIRNSKSIYSKISELLLNNKIDYLINNSGITVFKSVINTSVEETDDIISTNLNGAIYLTKSVLPSMINHGSGTIINIISVAANTIFTESSIYSASKAGLLAFANVLREEVREKNIRVVNVLPGAVATPIWHPKALEKNGSKMMQPDDLAEYIFANLIENSVVAEEIIFRPISGDK